MKTKEHSETVKLPTPKTDIQRLIKKIRDRVSDELEAFDWPWDTLAEQAGLSVTTVYRFRDRQYRDSPLLSTVLKIAQAVGLEVTIDHKQKRARIRRAG